MIWTSIRWRLQLWYGLLLALLLGGFGLTAYRGASRDLRNRLNDRAMLNLRVVLRPPPPPGERPGEGPPEGPGPGMRGPRPGRERVLGNLPLPYAAWQERIFYIYWDEAGKVLAQSKTVPQGIARPAVSEREQWFDEPGPGKGRPPGGGPPPGHGELFGSYFCTWVGLPDGDVLLLGENVEDELSGLRQFAWLLLAAGSAILALGLAGGFWVATRAIRPIDEISRAARRIADGDLSQRIAGDDNGSELGRLAGVLNETFARLEAAFRQQTRFTADASHELRTPLAVILSQTQTALSRERSAGEYREALEACQRAGQRMRRLTESLLELARLDANAAAAHAECDLAQIAKDGVDLLRPLAEARGLRVETELESAPCRGNADQLGQLVMNLVSNAIQFNRDGGGIRVVTKAAAGVVRLEVADTGAGIAAADLPHLFERFYRADKSRARQQGHAGLGLAIAKAVADAHGAALQASSTEGEGTVFVFELPTA